MAYTEKQIEETFTEICRQMAEEGKSLRSVLRSKDMPGSETFYKWLDSSEVKSKQYTRATTQRAEEIFEDILDIADKQDKDIYTVDGVEMVDHNVHARAKIMIDARKWMLGKMNPKKYSDKIQVDTTEFSEQPLFPDVQKDNSNK